MSQTVTGGACGCAVALLLRVLRGSSGFYWFGHTISARFTSILSNTAICIYHLIF